VVEILCDAAATAAEEGTAVASLWFHAVWFGIDFSLHWTRGI
jgi:hypothetical protein